MFVSRGNVPGEAGVDFPLHSLDQRQQFSCQGREPGGYYADPALDCQVYHVCLPLSSYRAHTKWTFICPNGTLFDQAKHVCDWW